ncbi:dTDP-4-dehydrorhamnose reductase [Actinomadura opuntiae]|uniref:dTDP-4-dehydrorhamnose reductase n=1 Tax=Actinomadura sp. OS1-43 TaxID=604315 RepID=UPI00255A9E77|nr:dTDP-4-dehydrorhamnose reductase [Actinomadura sp. OS1-43]MDL4820258.1 dTDP-4-dehydrorhamnose reductase [Actinomadura sp. OS1-43]
MTRWMITGAGGVLGRELRDVLRGEAAETVALTRGDLDLTDPGAVRAAVRRHRPSVLVNCAAWTDFRAAEEAEDDALRINGGAVAALARACADESVRLVHVSTDYVFDGTAREPYAEDAPVRPLSAYGRTKLAGERAVADLVAAGRAAIVRTAWLYSRYGTDFVRVMARMERAGASVEAADDEWGQPTWAADAARQIVALAGTGAAGVFHATSGGAASRRDLASEVFRLLGADPDRVRPVRADRFPGARLRPRYTVLGHAAWSRAGLAPIRDWREALEAAFPQLDLPA